MEVTSLRLVGFVLESAAVFGLAVNMSFGGIARAEDRSEDERLWISAVGAITAQRSELASNYESRATFDSVTELTKAAENGVRDNPRFADLVRQSMTEDSREWVQNFAAGVLWHGLTGKASTNDLLSMINHTNALVRITAMVWIKADRRQDFAVLLPFGLMSTNVDERDVAIVSMRFLCGRSGLPYYRTELYDPSVYVARHAAAAFATCEKGDAVAPLLRYLKQHGTNPDSRPVSSAAIGALEELFGEPRPKEVPLEELVRKWTDRLDKYVMDDLRQRNEQMKPSQSSASTPEEASTNAVAVLWPVPPGLPTFGTPSEKSIRVVVYGAPRALRAGNYYLQKGATVRDAVAAAEVVRGGIYWGLSGVARPRLDGSFEIIHFTEKTDRSADMQILLQDGDRLYFAREVY